MNENEESKPKQTLTASGKRKPNRKGRSRQSAIALLTMPDPTKVNVEDLIPQSCRDEVKRTKGKKGGVLKYRPDIVRPILQNVQIGMTEEKAAQLVGINPRTLSAWKGKWGDLSEALACVHARCEQKLVGTVVAGMEKHPRLALEMLERKDPKNWASHSKHQVAGVMMQTQISPEMLAGLYGARSERDGSGDEESPDSEQQVIDI
jgi:hypothetical protein